MRGMSGVLAFIFLGAAFFFVLILSLSTTEGLQAGSSDASFNETSEVLTEQAEIFSTFAPMWFPITILVIFFFFVLFMIGVTGNR